MKTITLSISILFLTFFTCVQNSFSQGCCNATFSSNELQNLTWAFYPEDSINVANYSWEWEFGDGTISTDISPLHTYPVSGKYNVKLVKKTESIINQDTVISSCTSSKYIIVNATYTTDSCFAAFSVLQTGGFATLIPQSIVNSNNYSYWTFGDGNSAYGKYQTHQYLNSGTYTVCQYKAKDSTNITSSGCNFCKDINVVVDSVITYHNDSCFTNYFYNNSGANFSFIDSINTNSNNYSYWTFGDGVSTYGQFPSHTYLNSGTYTVCQYKSKDSINITSTGCNVCKIINVVVDSISTHPADSCSANYYYYVSGPSIALKDSMSIDSSYYSYWTFGDGTSAYGKYPTHTYSNSSNYNVCQYKSKDSVNITSSGCNVCKVVNIVVDSIVAPPIDSCFAGFTYSLSNDTLRLYANVTSGNHVWYMGDGNYVSGGSSITHNYIANNTYNICHFIRTTSGDSCHECKSISIQKPIVSPNPADNFININSTQDSLVSYTLIDNLGTTVASQYNINSMQASIPTQNIPSGYYTVRIVYGLNRNAFYNVLIQH